MKSKKNCNIKETIINVTNNKPPAHIVKMTEKKLHFFKEIIQKTILHVQKNRTLEILEISDVNNCIEKLCELNSKIKGLSNKLFINTTIPDSNVYLDTEILINELQSINNELSCIFKSYGTYDLDDLLIICFGNNNVIEQNNPNEHVVNNDIILKLDLLRKHFHPISYKILNKSDDKYFKNLDCYDINSSYTQFHAKVHGIKLFIYSNILDKRLFVYGILDDIFIDLLDNKYIIDKKEYISKNIPNESEFKSDSFDNYINSLSLKDYLLNANTNDFYNKFAGYLSQNNILKQKTILQNIKDFIADDLFSKRNTLIYLLIKSSNYENQYLAYLLYDLLSNDVNGKIDTDEQILLYDSFPWSIKQIFKKAMKNTIKYTNELSNFDMNKIPLEQQICLLKASDNVKEKAMIKLKEIKSKTEDSGSKARQYLDGLLKIPFSIYKKEPILHMMDIIRNKFKEVCVKYNLNALFPEIVDKDKYTSLEIKKYIKLVNINYMNSVLFDNKYLSNLKKHLQMGDKQKLIENAILINTLVSKYNLTGEQINYQSKNKNVLKLDIEKFINFCKSSNKLYILNELEILINNKINNDNKNGLVKFNDLKISLIPIQNNINEISDYVNNVKTILDRSVYGHDKAKRQIERIVSQWINGEQNGNCFGFEGSPGVGKTTLAKGLSECLKDENNNSRPFSLIMMGGDSNGSHLVGHSYTYVGSNWGQIVQILIDKKCMNPIILIDEVDKISKTEHGKEITGILTHLLDPSQNNSFQDKYFSGIDLDLSKVLFILSYNDPDSIDKILLDRVHRIKFDSLSIEDKVIISSKYLLPDIYKNIGLEGMINISNDTLKFIIEEYTLEAGVRKLKEKLFEIVGEINLKILKNNDDDYNIPIEVTIDDIKNIYLKDIRTMRAQKIHDESKVGVINCLWANNYNVGGILSASAKFFPSNNYLSFKLTGLLDKMMEESFQISFTNAFNLISEERKKEVKTLYDADQKYGIHLHMGDGSIEKSGTSAGIAVTILLFSLLSNKKIKNDFAVTGEASDLNGKVGEIGALKTKIIYGIKAGVKNFIYPVENEKDFNEFMDKYGNSDIVKGVSFHPILNIQEALDLIIEK